MASKKTEGMKKASRWSDFEMHAPQWFEDAPLGIFVHWGPYSVPAWAEPKAELGTLEDDREWFTHNSYAEWYWNTIRIEGSPAQTHHRDTYGDAEYESFLDTWQAENFDANELVKFFTSIGADYLVPTTKHHDGVTLWDAPGTHTRNTVHRGPKRDLIGEFAVAAQDHGMRFGVYYSGGLDWHVRPFPPHLSNASVHDSGRPKDAEYAGYAFQHVKDLIDRYSPDLLWNDIEWPDEGKHFGPEGLGTLFNHFYTQRPEGLVNDRWGKTHRDYGTSEYQASLQSEGDAQWENCRGIGLSFGYNQVEDTTQTMTGKQIARHLVDVVSRGGRLLLNVGPKADGTIPEVQRQSLADFGEWMATGKQYLVKAKPTTALVFHGPEWVRCVELNGTLVVFVDADSPVAIPLSAAAEVSKVEALNGSASIDAEGNLQVSPSADRLGPTIVTLETAQHIAS